MSGLSTNGLAAPTFPLVGSETVAIDTNYASGIQPQTASITLKQLSAIGIGSRATLTDAATITADASTGSSFAVTLGATGRTLTMSNGSPGQVVDVQVIQDGTGSRTITTYTNVLWAAGTAPTLTVTAAAVDLLRFTWDATRGKWFGETVGKAYA